MAKKGEPQTGKTDALDPSKPIRASVPLPPGDPVRIAYEEMIASMNVSGAEVLRRAIKHLWDTQGTAQRAHLREAG